MGLRLAVAVASVLASSTYAGGVDQLHARDAGADIALVAQDVAELRELAQRHLETVGLAQAILDFSAAPWKRQANGLHIWGVTRSGISWFDAGHPELVGLDVSQMSDLDGRMWASLAVQSAADGARFELLFPHPTTGRAATGVHSCFLLDDAQRVLCAGAFEDVGDLPD